MSDDQPGIDSGATAWLLCCTALVFIMLPALAVFYGGLSSNKAVVNTMLLTFLSFCTVSFVWSLIGYSLAFGTREGPGDAWLGDGYFGAFDSLDRLRPGTDVSEHAFFSFQLMFATITAAVVSGAVINRIHLWAWAAFSTVWCLLVYVPLARWIFYSGGWLATYGVLDFAGGLVVETASGVSAFVLAFLLGPGKTAAGSAHNVPFVLLGMVSCVRERLGRNHFHVRRGVTVTRTNTPLPNVLCRTGLAVVRLARI